MDLESGVFLDSVKITSLKDFLMGLINAAKDWQDRLQSILPGYRERIANIYLKSDEGGIHLSMSATKIDHLVNLGERAAALITGKPLDPSDERTFEFDEHRWRRYLIAFARLEEALELAQQTWNGSDRFAEFIKNYQPSSYRKSNPEWDQWRLEVFERFNSMMTLASSWAGKSLRLADEGRRIPRPESALRITPKPH
jgi:hypothetical protein